MKLKLFKIKQPRQMFHVFDFIVEAPKQVAEAYKQMVGISKEEEKRNRNIIGTIIGYIYYGSRWEGPFRVNRHELREASRLEFVVQEGIGFEGSLPSFLRKVNET